MYGQPVGVLGDSELGQESERERWLLGCPFEGSIILNFPEHGLQAGTGNFGNIEVCKL
jgi:hypothetical protein